MTPEHRADRDDQSKQHCLNRPRHDQHRPRVAMPQGRMRDVEKRRTAFGFLRS
jgi:hypothetical protein